MAGIESLSGTPQRVHDLTDAIFRSNPDYELIHFDLLPQGEQEGLADLLKDPHFYGILRSNNKDLGMKSVCRDTALLLFTLKTAGKLPRYVRDMFGPRFNEVIARLVLDRILEIKTNDKFVSGSDAYPFIYLELPTTKLGGLVGSLSIEALKYGQSLELDDYFKLSARLYFYNRFPVSSHWKNLFSSEEAIIEYLGLRPGDQNRSILENYWIKLRPSLANNRWLSWSSKDALAIRRSYKLYVSPRCEQLGETFSTMLEVLTELRAPSFKIGKDIYGLLRPDKMVVYFTTYDEMNEAAARLLNRLKGISAHAVPFTAAIDPNGLLSWGMDPPHREQFSRWQGPSWRRWVTDRLAVALITAKASSTIIEPWQFALDRLALEGVDTTSWIPKPTIWSELGMGGI